MYNAIGMIELSSVARGIVAADRMVKAAQVEIVSTGSVCPGKFIVIVKGDVAAAQSAVEAGILTAEEFLVDSFVLPNVHEGIFPAITATTQPLNSGAYGILETFSLSCMIPAADAALKAADIHALELRMGYGLGGKATFTFTGEVAAAEAALAAGRQVASEAGLLVNAEVIPSIASSLWEALL